MRRELTVSNRNHDVIEPFLIPGFVSGTQKDSFRLGSNGKERSDGSPLL